MILQNRKKGETRDLSAGYELSTAEMLRPMIQNCALLEVEKTKEEDHHPRLPLPVSINSSPNIFPLTRFFGEVLRREAFSSPDLDLIS